MTLKCFINIQISVKFKPIYEVGLRKVDIFYDSATIMSL